MTPAPAPFRVPRRVLLGPGPSEVPTAVSLALAEPPLGHLDPAFLAILDETAALLRRAFCTTNELTFPVSGTGTAGIETMLTNVIEPGDAMVVAVNGYFGARLAEIAKRVGARVHVVEGAWGGAADVEAVLAAQRTHGARLVGIVHAETSTGVRTDLAELGRELRARDALLLVDAVTSLGAIELRVDDWMIDACSSCSQKGLGAPSGLAPLTIGPRALAKIAARKSTPATFYLDLALLQSYVGPEHKYHHTASSPLINALRTALHLVFEEGLEARFARHARVHAVARAGLEERGFSYVPPVNVRLPHLNCVRPRAGVDEKKLRAELLRRQSIEIGGGLGPLAGQVVRIGLMGASATETNVTLLLAALDECLR
ncbi:MAG: alanine--glyoxylate aminotransferase family protein [Planctomycetes bacterium]|nr:alanine--glyoxylate aminotransferase family protein [Planctomycetota bacterium]